MGGSEYHDEVTGVILAGGQARRFGGVLKAALEIDGQRILDRQLAALRGATSAQFVVANDAGGFGDLGVPVLPDIIPDVGPLGGLLTALTAAATARILVLACDLPFVDTRFLRFLVDRAPEAAAVVPRTLDGLQPLCAVYATRLRSVAETRLAAGRRSVAGFVDEVSPIVLEPSELAPFDGDGRLFMNINTPADYDAARTRHRAFGVHAPQELR